MPNKEDPGKENYDSPWILNLYVQDLLGFWLQSNFREYATWIILANVCITKEFIFLFCIFGFSFLGFI